MDKEQISQKLHKALAKLYITIGLEKPPTTAEIEVVSGELLKYNSHITIEEIIIGLEMNASHKLDTFVKHYQLFSIEYVTEIVKQYMEKKYEIMIDFNNKIAESYQLEQPKKSTPQECFNFIKKHFQENKTLPLTADWSSCFDWMWYEKILKEEPLKVFMSKEKPRYIERINGLIKTSTTTFEKNKLELELSDGAISLHLRKKYIHENAEKLFN
jgi:hypothetical protein